MPILQSLWAQAWCLLILISFIGWGCGTFRLLGAKIASIGVAASVGTAVAVCIGGLLNLLQLIVPWALFIFLAAGVALAFLSMRWIDEAPLEIRILRRLNLQPWPWRRIALICFALMVLFRVGSSTRTLRYLQEDDCNFYLATPLKMMQTHYYAADPFSERRIESSLGASYFLQNLELISLPIENIQMLDRGIGFVMFLLLILALAEQLGLSPPETLVIGTLATVLTPVIFNLTFSTLPSALVLTMVLVALRPEDFRLRPNAQALVVGLTAGGLCTLKSTFLPFACLFCLILCARMAAGFGWKAAVARLSSAMIGALLVLAPWMVAMRMTSGTFFYPLLGSGYDFSAYAQFPMPFHGDPLMILRRGATFYVPLTLILLAQILLLRRARSTVLLVTTIAAFFSTLATGYGTGGDDVQRYNFALVVPTFMLSFYHVSQEIRLNPRGWIAHGVRAGVVFLLAGYIWIHAAHGQYMASWQGFRMCFTGDPNTSAEMRKNYQEICAAFPKDGRILTTLQNAYLISPLDERTLLADFPGCAGPPPGWPVRENGEALARYLLSQSVRYLAYTYVGNSQLDYCLGQDFSKWSVRAQVQYGTYLLADKQYRELRQTRKVLYDDGTVFILDLATPADHL